MMHKYVIDLFSYLFFRSFSTVVIFVKMIVICEYFWPDNSSVALVSFVVY